MTVWAVHVVEEYPPAGVEPLEWLLLTTWAVPSAIAALECVEWYACRFGIEVWHKVLKHGCRIEARQLESAARLQRCLTLFSVIAWRIEASGGAIIPSWERAMRWDELARLASDGHELGSHSATHAILLRECAPDLAAEVAGSKRALETRLGIPVRSFCYPSGLYDEAALGAVAAAGYENATTTRAGVNRANAAALELHRIDIDGVLNARRDGAASESVLAWRLARGAA